MIPYLTFFRLKIVLALTAITSLFPLFADAAFFNYENPLMLQQMPAAVSDIISHPDLISAALSQNIKVAPANTKRSRISFQPAPSSPLTTARLDNAGSSFNAFTMKHGPEQRHAFPRQAPFNYDDSLITEKILPIVSDVLSHPDLLLAPAAQDGAKTPPAHREESKSIQRDSALSLTSVGVGVLNNLDALFYNTLYAKQDEDYTRTVLTQIAASVPLTNTPILKRSSPVAAQPLSVHTVTRFISSVDIIVPQADRAKEIPQGSGVRQSDNSLLSSLSNRISDFETKFKNFDPDSLIRTVQLSQRIGQLSGATLSSITFSQPSSNSFNLTDTDIPDTITASNYLGLGGGTLTGSLTGTTMTLSSNLLVSGNIGIATTSPGSILSIQGVGNFVSNATSTLYAGFNIPIVNISSTTATSTFGNGIQLSGGCFKTADGTCAGSGGGTTNSGTINRLAYYSGATILDSANFLTVDASNSFLGIGTTSPGTLFSIQGAANFSNTASSTIYGTTTTGNLIATTTIGIGTSTPGSLLSVQGNAQITGTTTSSALVATSTLFVGAQGQLFNVMQNGNVGIGTAAPIELLHIVSAGTPFVSIQSAAGNNDAGMHLYHSTTLKWDIRNNGNNDEFFIIPSSQNDGNSAFTILQSGNVGIATTTPGTLFSIQGAANFSNTASSTIYGTTTTANLIATSTLGIGTSTPGSIFSVQGNAQVTGTTTSSALVATSTLFVGAQGQLFSVMQSGNVGIGTVAPASALHVVGSIQIGASAGSDYSTGGLLLNSHEVFVGAASSQSNRSLIFANSSGARLGSVSSGWYTTNLRVELGNGSGVSLGVDSTGNIGIGTTTPGSLLSVQGAANFSNTGITLYGTTTLPNLISTSTATSSFAGPVSINSLILLSTTTFPNFISTSTIATSSIAGPISIGSLTISALTNLGSTSPLANNLFTVGSSSLAVTYGDNVAIGPVGGFSDAPMWLQTPASKPASTGEGSAWSPDGIYLAVVDDSSPLTIYKRQGDTFAKLADPATLPAAASYGASFSPNGNYLAVASGVNGSPFVYIYKRNGDTFLKLPNPATLPPAAASGVSFSPDGTYLAISHASSPYLTIYKQNGDTFTKLPNPASLPGSTANGISFSPDGTYLALVETSSPFVDIYKRSGDTFLKLPNPANLPGGAGNGLAFSPDGTYLAIANSNSDDLAMYKRTGDTFTRLGSPSNLLGSPLITAAFSPDGVYFAVGGSSSPFVAIYTRSGDTFTRLANPVVLPPNTGRGASFSPDGTYLALAHSTTPFITIYKGWGSAAHKLELAVGTSTSQGIGFGKEVTLYRGAPYSLNLSAGNSFDIDFGELRMGMTGTTSTSSSRTTVIDSSLAGFFSRITTSSTVATSSFANALYVGSSTPAGWATTLDGSVATASPFFAVGTSSPLFWIDHNTGHVGIATTTVESGTASTTLTVNGNMRVALPSTGIYAVCHSNDSATTPSQLEDCSASPVADYAEQYPTEQGTDYGDIVSVGSSLAVTNDGNRISVLAKSSKPYQQNIIGVVSNNYGDFSSIGYNINKSDNPYPIALNGRVPVKISTEGGGIKRGDKITSSSLAGTGMKATASGTAIGTALDDFDGSDATTTATVNGHDVKVGKIMIFMNLGYAKMDDQITSAAEIADVNRIWAIDQTTGKVSARFTNGLDLSGSELLNVSKILSANGTWSIDENGKLVVQNLEVKGATKIGTPSSPQGITLYDPDGNPYCVRVGHGGNLGSAPGECGSDGPSSFVPSPSSGGSTPTPTPAPTPSPSASPSPSETPQVSPSTSPEPTASATPSPSATPVPSPSQSPVPAPSESSPPSPSP